MNQLTLTKVSEVPPPRFISPRQRIPYQDARIQAAVKSAFDGLLPEIISSQETEVTYLIDHSTKSNHTIDLTPCPLAEFSKLAAVKLISGHRKLRSLAEKKNQDPGFTALLHNFRLPDPKRDNSRYLVYKDSKGVTQPVILWGYQDPSIPFIHIDETLEAFDLSDDHPQSSQIAANTSSLEGSETRSLDSTLKSNGKAWQKARA